MYIYKKSNTKPQIINYSGLRIIFAVFLLFFLFFCSSFFKVQATAGINKVINFQGKLVNKSDSTNITDATYSFTFKFYDAASGGNLLPSGTGWSETQSLALSSGIFRASIGSSVAIPAALDFNSDSIYLDVTFNGETFSSRVRMTAVPYAINAEKVAGLTVTNTTGGLTVANGATLNFGGNFATGSNALTFSTTGTTGLTLPTSGTLTTGNGLSNYLARWTSSGNLSTGISYDNGTTVGIGYTNVNSAGVLEVNGNVGIGTTNPSARLQIVGAGTGVTFALRIQDSAFADKFVILDNGNVGIGTTSPFGLLSVGAGMTVGFHVQTNGNVGIGTTAASSLLEVANGNAKFDGGLVISKFVSGGTGSWIDMPTAGPSGLGSGGAGSSPWIAYSSAGGQWFDVAAAADINYRNLSGALNFGNAANNIAMRIKSGNIGMGTTSPTNKLDVIGAVSIGFNGSTAAPTNGLIVNGNVGIGNTSATGYKLDVAGAIRGTTLESSGPIKVGVTTAASSTTLCLDGSNFISACSSGGTFTGTGLANYLVRWTSATNLSTGITYDNGTSVGIGYTNVNSSGKFVVNGNVGIGTTNPGAKLQLLGNGTTTGINLRIQDNNGADKFVILDNGRVGIGTTLPLVALHVVGDGSYAASFMNGNVGIGITSNGAKLTLRGNSTTTGINFHVQDSNGADKLVIQDNGNVGIGTTVPQNRLDVNGSMAIGSLPGASLPQSNSLYVSGNIGIGTTNPAHQLDVIGRINASDLFFYSDFVGNRASITSANRNFMDNIAFNKTGTTGCTASSPGATNGILTGTTGASSGDACAFTTMGGNGTKPFVKGNNIVLEASLLFNNVTSDTAYIGLSDGVGSAPSNGAYFTFTAGGQWSAVTTLSSTSTSDTSVGSPVTATPYQKLRIELSASTAKFYINGIQVGTTHTTNLPTGNLDLQILLITDTTAARSMDIDYVKIWSDWPPAGGPLAPIASNPLSLTDYSDLAEAYPANERSSIQSGDLVSADPDKKGYVSKTKKSHDPLILGVVSQQPGVVLNDSNQDTVLVALSGRVDVKIASSSPEIKVGDWLVSSDEPGKAMKAQKAGLMIGRALENWTPDSGQEKILMFIQSVWVGDSEINLAEINFLESQTVSADLLKAKGLTIIGDDGLEKIVFDNQGNAFFAGTVTADTIKAKHIEGLDMFEEKLATLEGQIAGLSTNVTDVNVASMSALLSTRLDVLDKRVHDLEISSFMPTASQEAMLRDASSSANLNATVVDLLVNNNLTVLGKTNLNSLGVIGDITTGVLVINGLDTKNGANIYTLSGSLKLQASALGDIEIMNDLIHLDTKGNVRLKEGDIVLEKGKIQGNDSFTGRVTVPHGETKVVVEKKWDNPPISIIATPSFNSRSWVSDISKTGFTINVDSSAFDDKEIYWVAFFGVIPTPSPALTSQQP